MSGTAEAIRLTATRNISTTPSGLPTTCRHPRTCFHPSGHVLATSFGQNGAIVISQGQIPLIDSTATNLVVKSFPVAGGAGYGIVQLADDGATIEWSLPRTTADGVAVVGDTAYLLADDAASPTGRSLIVRSATTTWRSDISGLRGTPVVAGGLVYLEHQGEDDGTGVAVFDAAGCGAPLCDEIRTLDAGPSCDSLYGMAVTAGTLFVHKVGHPGALIAYRP
jgi:hypothetical protein